MYRYLLIIWLIIFFAFTATAQKPDTVAVKNKKDSLNLKRDSISSKPFVPPAKVSKEKVYHPDSTHSPHKAVMRSLIIPGWGQLYNHRWWKVPIIYGGLGLLGVAIQFNQHYYSILVKEAQLRERGIQAGRRPEYVNVSDANIISASDGYRRNRDLSILGIVGAWGINMIDAYIDAKFIKSYTMDNNLSFKVAPGVIDQPIYAFNRGGEFIPALKITFTLK